MKLLDQNTISHFHMPELVLMEQAAMVFVWKLSAILQGQAQKGIVFCGTGNNGADGMAIARLLNERGIETAVFPVKEAWQLEAKQTESYKTQEAIYTTYNYPRLTDIRKLSNEKYDFVIDAVFGIGLSRALSAEYLQIVDTINAIGAMTIAVDMPSGISSDNGQVMGNAVKCDYTITFSYAKRGQYLWPGCDYAGEVIVADMGITNRSWLEKKPGMAYLEEADVKNIATRPAHSNKGTFGKLLIIAGSPNMAGAAILSAKAAYHNGVGLVKIFTSEANRVIIQTSVPEAILTTYGEHLDETELINAMKWADAIVIGPGLGTSAVARKLVHIVQQNAAVPVVWDADALNLMAQDVNALSMPHTEFILTPHLGEFSRLTGKEVVWIQNSLVESALEFARMYDVICVLKDSRTVIANPYGMSYLNLSGNNGMATAGSGDVLTGIIGAFLAQGMKGIDAAAYGVYVHGMAGDAAMKRMGTHGVTASDVIEGLIEVWNKMENK